MISQTAFAAGLATGGGVAALAQQSYGLSALFLAIALAFTLAATAGEGALLKMARRIHTRSRL